MSFKARRRIEGTGLTYQNHVLTHHQTIPYLTNPKTLLCNALTFFTLLMDHTEDNTHPSTNEKTTNKLHALWL